MSDIIGDKKTKKHRYQITTERLMLSFLRWNVDFKSKWLVEQI